LREELHVHTAEQAGCHLLMTGWKFAEYVLTRVHTENTVCCQLGNVCVVQGFHVG